MKKVLIASDHAGFDGKEAKGVFWRPINTHLLISFHVISAINKKIYKLHRNNLKVAIC